MSLACLLGLLLPCVVRLRRGDRDVLARGSAVDGRGGGDARSVVEGRAGGEVRLWEGDVIVGERMTRFCHRDCAPSARERERLPRRQSPCVCFCVRMCVRVQGA
jgi:hypothetical protein